MTEVVAGWYPDPAGGPTPRWWDGQQWTDQVQPLYSDPRPQQPQPVAYGQTPSQQPSYGQYGQAPLQQPSYGQYGQAPLQQPTAPQTGYQPGASGYGVSPTGYVAGAGGYGAGYPVQPAGQSIWRQNRYTAITLAVAIGYVVIAVTAHLVVIGIVPILMSVRAFRAGEKFRAVAAVAAGAAVLFSLMMLGG